MESERIIEAFERIERKNFLPEEVKEMSEIDKPLFIGHGQTISQPAVVAFMLEKLNPQKGEKILDIGSGSGWTTALLADLVGEKGRVIGLEIIPELVKFGKDNVSHYSFTKEGRAKIIKANGRKGYEKEAPFDKILASAQAEKIPESWKKQLKVGGRIVAPVKNSLYVLEKKEENKFTKEKYEGFAFVPLVK